MSLSPAKWGCDWTADQGGAGLVLQGKAPLDLTPLLGQACESAALVLAGCSVLTLAGGGQRIPMAGHSTIGVSPSSKAPIRAEQLTREGRGGRISWGRASTSRSASGRWKGGVPGEGP
jgi:hypothetical protein